MRLRGKRRAWWMQLTGLLGGAPRGFFVPYRHAAKVTAPRTYPELGLFFDRFADRFAQELQTTGSFADELHALQGPPPAPRFDQDWFPRLDAAMAYTIVRSRRPERIIEIGSGHSTRFMAQALARNGEGRLISFDPAPRATLVGLPIEQHRRLLAEADLPLIAGLQAGEILFVDSSHLAMPGTDVDLLASRILPAMAPGVILHVHDILLPDGYPADWAWRGYNEQTVIAAALAGRAFEPLFASHYVATRMVDALATSSIAGLPLLSGARETSLWLIRC